MVVSTWSLNATTIRSFGACRPGRSVSQMRDGARGSESSVNCAVQVMPGYAFGKHEPPFLGQFAGREARLPCGSGASIVEKERSMSRLHSAGQGQAEQQ